MNICATVSQGSKRSLDYPLAETDYTRKYITEGLQLLQDLKGWYPVFVQESQKEKSLWDEKVQAKILLIGIEKNLNGNLFE